MTAFDPLRSLGPNVKRAAAAPRENVLLNIMSRLFFYVALALSSLLTIMLLSAAANFGFGQVLAAGPSALLIVIVMLLNPVIFGLLGFIKGTSKWHIVATTAMLTLLLFYTLAAFGVFGPLPARHI